MDALLLVGIAFIVGAAGGWFVSRRGNSRSTESHASPQQESVILRHFASTNLVDNEQTLNDLLELIAGGQRAMSLDDEVKSLRRQIYKLEKRAERAPSPYPALEVSTGVQSGGQDFQSFRNEARRVLDNEFPYAIDQDTFGAICDLTDFERAWEREQKFQAAHDRDSVLQMLGEDWFHSVLRTDALVRTYCQNNVQSFTSGIRLLAASLRLVAASHGIGVYPTRLLLPSNGAAPDDDEPIAELVRIPEVKQTISKLAQVTTNYAALNIAIDCRRVRVIGQGIDIPAKLTPFDPRDWG